MTSPQTRSLPLARRSVGILACVFAAVAAVLFAAAAWNPWRYVVFTRYLHNPVLGVLCVALLGTAAAWLLLPVHSEAAQGRRVMFKFLMIAVVVLSAICWGVTRSAFVLRYDVTVLTHSPDGRLTIASVQEGERSPEVRVWQGSGLLARDVGVLGPACGLGVTAKFTSPDHVTVDTAYGTFTLQVDPATGKPRTTFGPTCNG